MSERSGSPYVGDPGRDELDTKIMRSSAWSLLGYGGATALALGTTIVLARLLTPSDFGLVALAITMLAIAQMIQESGLGAALIVHRGDVRRAAATVVLVAPLISLALYAVFFAAAPLAAEFFDEPRLTDVLRVMALVLVLRGLSVAPSALLQRQMRFGAFTAKELGAGVAQAVVAVTLAKLGAGVWSLVAGQLALAATSTLLAWVLTPIRPSPREARWATLQELAGYGRHVAFANVLNYGSANAPGIVIGRVLGATALGYYSVASRLASLPVQVVGNILGRGVFPALARVADDPARFRQIWLENVQRLALLSTPAGIALALVAQPFVVVVLGEQWDPAIAVLQLLALNGLVATYAATSGEVFQALGRPKLRWISELAYLTLIVPALLVGATRWGLVGAAAAVVLVSSCFGAFVVAFVARLLGVRLNELAHAVARPALGWVVMASSMLLVHAAVAERSAALELVAMAAVGGGIYALVVWLFARDLVLTMWVNLRGARP